MLDLGEFLGAMAWEADERGGGERVSLGSDGQGHVVELVSRACEPALP